MAGFFSDIGEFFTGDKGNAAQGQANDLANQTAEEQAGIASGQDTLASGANAQAAGYDQGARESLGTNAADYVQKANAAAQGQAGQEASAASVEGAKNALMAARTAGLNRGQAAVQAGQQATQNYAGTLNNSLQLARQMYQNASQQFANQGTALAARGMNYQQAGQNARQFGYNARNQGNQQNLASAAQSAQAGGNTISGLASGAAMLLSDKNQKAGIVDSRLVDKVRGAPGAVLTPDLDQLIAKVKPVDYVYKAGSGEDPNLQRKGVLAQDLEKTSMGDNVKDTPQGKMIDAGQQTMSNTNLIVQLAQELYDLKGQLAARGK